MNRVTYRTFIVGFIVLIAIVAAALLGGFWMIQGNISSFQEEQVAKDSIRDIIRVNNGPMIIDYSDVDSLGNVQLSENDLAAMNEHIKYLTFELEEEYVKTQELIDSDIERIGILMTITIGILTLLLGVLPFLSNLITRQDMRDTVNDLSFRIDNIDDTTSIAESANKSAKEAKEIANAQKDTISKVHSKTEDLSKRIPQVIVMSVHVAISRMINITNHAQNGSGTNRFSYMRKTVEQIRDSLDDCKNKNIFPKDNKFLKIALVDLYFALDNWSFAVAIFGRRVQELIPTWAGRTLSLAASKNISENEFNELIEVMNEIIAELDGQEKKMK